MQITISIIQGQREDIIAGFAVNLIDAPALTGTPKQIAWAEKIRAASIDDMVRLMMLEREKLASGRMFLSAQFKTDEVTQKIDAMNKRLAERVTPHLAATAAKDWIEASNGDKDIATAKALMMRSQAREREATNAA